MIKNEPPLEPSFTQVVNELKASRFFTEHEAKVAFEKYEMLQEDKERRKIDQERAEIRAAIEKAKQCPAAETNFCAPEYDFPKIGSVWRHKKSGFNYIVLECDNDLRLEETRQYAVKYQQTGGGMKWLRPLKEFLEKFDLLRNKMAPEDMCAQVKQVEGAVGLDKEGAGYTMPADQGPVAASVILVARVPDPVPDKRHSGSPKAGSIWRHKQSGSKYEVLRGGQYAVKYKSIRGSRSPAKFMALDDFLKKFELFD